jgi:uncharacterized membrane protein YqhA
VRLFRHLLKLRYVAVVITLITALHALACLVLGVKSAIKGYRQVLAGSDATERPGIEILHSLDLLFVSIVFIVVALGIAKLFLLAPSAQEDASLPVWLRINKISELKVLLWETILVTMVVVALSEFTASIYSTHDWTVLLTPAAILLLALSLYFMKKA